MLPVGESHEGGPDGNGTCCPEPLTAIKSTITGLSVGTGTVGAINTNLVVLVGIGDGCAGGLDGTYVTVFESTTIL